MVKGLIIIIMTALILSGIVVNDSSQDIQRVMRSQRARRRKNNKLELFLDY